MSTDPNKRHVPITDTKTGKVRLSEAVSLHVPRATATEVTDPMPLDETSVCLPIVPTEHMSGPKYSDGEAALNSPVTTPISTSPDIGSSLNMPARDVDVAALVGKTGNGGKQKVDIETLEQFIAHAYSRKGQRLTLKPKTEQLIGQTPHLDEDAMRRLYEVAAGDVLLAVPRQLLLVSREVEGIPALRAGLNSFVATVLLKHSIFASNEMQAAVRNLPDAPPMSTALRVLSNYEPSEVEGIDRLKPSESQTLRRNAVHLLVTWFACNRGLSSEEMVTLLLQALWAPAASELVDDNARLRALTEVEQPAAVGLACHRFRQQTIEARSAMDQAQRDSLSLHQQLAVANEQLQQVTVERDALRIELEGLRVSSADDLAQMRAQHEVQRMHLRHELEQLRGRLVRRLQESIEMLDVGLKALRNKTPRTEVMAERAEHVIDALRAELTNLNED
jgi:hypothetical protein